MSALSPRQMFLLDIACAPIRDAFDAKPYLVGTAAEYRERKQYRDVDVRLILDDEQYDALAAGLPSGVQSIAFLGLAIGQYLAAMSGLPIDFQIQRRTEANARHAGPRNPLGIRSLASYVGDAPPDENPGGAQ